MDHFSMSVIATAPCAGGLVEPLSDRGQESILRNFVGYLAKNCYRSMSHLQAKVGRFVASAGPVWAFQLAESSATWPWDCSTAILVFALLSTSLSAPKPTGMRSLILYRGTRSGGPGKPNEVQFLARPQIGFNVIPPVFRPAKSGDDRPFARRRQLSDA